MSFCGGETSMLCDFKQLFLVTFGNLFLLLQHMFKVCTGSGFYSHLEFTYFPYQLRRPVWFPQMIGTVAQ